MALGYRLAKCTAREDRSSQTVILNLAPNSEVSVFTYGIDADNLYLAFQFRPLIGSIQPMGWNPQHTN